MPIKEVIIEMKESGIKKLEEESVDFNNSLLTQCPYCRERVQTKVVLAMFGLFDYKTDIESNIFNSDVISHQTLKDTPLKELEKYEGILSWHTDIFTKEELEKFKNLKGIVRIGMGFDNVDIQTCGERGIVVSNVPDYGTEEVADSAMSLILNLMRKTFELGIETTLNSKWPSQSGMKGARRVRGKTLGLVGFGSIGKCVCMRAKAFGMNIIFYDPYVNHGIDKALNIKRYDDLDELLKDSDVVSVHALLNDETKYLINQKNIKLMKKDAYLINTARGPIIEEQAIINSLKNNDLAGVGLDVLEIEPYRGNLKEFKNLIITPHSAFYSEEGFIEMREKAAKELKRILEKKNPKYIVNQKYLK
eukprot:gene4168-7478_t